MSTKAMQFYERKITRHPSLTAQQHNANAPEFHVCLCLCVVEYILFENKSIRSHLFWKLYASYKFRMHTIQTRVLNSSHTQRIGKDAAVVVVCIAQQTSCSGMEMPKNSSSRQVNHRCECNSDAVENGNDNRQVYVAKLICVSQHWHACKCKHFFTFIVSHSSRLTRWRTAYEMQRTFSLWAIPLHLYLSLSPFPRAQCSTCRVSSDVCMTACNKEETNFVLITRTSHATRLKALPLPLPLPKQRRRQKRMNKNQTDWLTRQTDRHADRRARMQTDTRQRKMLCRNDRVGGSREKEKNDDEERRNKIKIEFHNYNERRHWRRI